MGYLMIEDFFMGMGELWGWIGVIVKDWDLRVGIGIEFFFF